MMIKLIVAILFITFPVDAQTPTVVYGASKDAPGHPDQYLLIQPENSPNPLGNPIVDSAPSEIIESDTPKATFNKPSGAGYSPESDANHSMDNQTPATPQNNMINQSATQDPQPFSESPEQQNNQIENSLYQGGDRIYDVQSFPLNDIKTITEPNVQPTITTYPEY